MFNKELLNNVIKNKVYNLGINTCYYPTDNASRYHTFNIYIDYQLIGSQTVEFISKDTSFGNADVPYTKNIEISGINKNDYLAGVSESTDSYSIPYADLPLTTPLTDILPAQLGEDFTIYFLKLGPSSGGSND